MQEPCYKACVAAPMSSAQSLKMGVPIRRGKRRVCLGVCPFSTVSASFYHYAKVRPSAALCEEFSRWADLGKELARRTSAVRCKRGSGRLMEGALRHTRLAPVSPTVHLGTRRLALANTTMRLCMHRQQQNCRGLSGFLCCLEFFLLVQLVSVNSI
jgi:hypothetical protein